MARSTRSGPLPLCLDVPNHYWRAAVHDGRMALDPVRVLQATDAVFPLSVPVHDRGVAAAAAALARCRALLESMMASIDAGAPEATGTVLRTLFETFLAGCWLLSDPDEALRAIARNDHVQENRHRKRLGLSVAEWELPEYGGEPSDDDVLSPGDFVKRTAKAVERAGGNHNVIHRGYRQLFGPESYASSHATMKAFDGHLTFADDHFVVVTRSRMSADDGEWRVPAAAALVLDLAADLTDRLGIPFPDAAEFT